MQNPQLERPGRDEYRREVPTTTGIATGPDDRRRARHHVQNCGLGKWVRGIGVAGMEGAPKGTCSVIDCGYLPPVT